jgi:LacI family transcriptional regulator
MVTIKDVARQAGVSVSTVSHVLSGKRPISEPTRLRVLDVVEKLHYRPNRLAQGLVSKTTRSLGLLVPDLANPFFSSMAEALEIEAHACGYSVILCNTNLDPVREDDYLQVLLSRQVDGLFYFPGTPIANPTLQTALTQGVPIIVMDERLDDLPGVFVDNVDGGRQIGELLAGLGHRRVIFLGGPEGLPTVVDRLAGVREGFRAQGTGDAIVHTFFGEYRAAYGYEAVHRFGRDGLLTLTSPGRPTAIIAANDTIALGALRALRELRFQIPYDCSLLGFDDIEIASLTTPSLTSVQQPVRTVAAAAVESLLSRVESGHVSDKNGSSDAVAYRSKVVLPVKLIIRESVAAPSG